MIVLRLSIKELRVSGIGVVTKTNPPLFNSLKYLNVAISLIRVLPIPVIILIAMAIPSFKLVYQQDVIPETDMTIKVIGHQWYWEYQYPEHDDISFESYMTPDDELEPGDIRLLTVDNHLVLPANKNIHVLVTAGDVLHSFAMPSLGVKKDAVPGRLNETWFNIDAVSYTHLTLPTKRIV